MWPTQQRRAGGRCLARLGREMFMISLMHPGHVPSHWTTTEIRRLKHIAMRKYFEPTYLLIFYSFSINFCCFLGFLVDFEGFLKVREGF